MIKKVLVEIVTPVIMLLSIVSAFMGGWHLVMGPVNEGVVLFMLGVIGLYVVSVLDKMRSNVIKKEIYDVRED